MAIPELLIGSSFQATVQAAELVGGTTINTQSGNTATNSSEGVNNLVKAVANRFVEYRGDIFTAHHTGNIGTVHRYSGGSWTQELNGPNGITLGGQTLGGFIANGGGVQRLFFVGQLGNGNNHYIQYSDDGTTWNTAASLLSESGLVNSGKSILFNNKAYSLAASTITPRCREFDPFALTATSIPVAWPSRSVQNGTDNGCFIVYDDRLFCVHIDDNIAGSGDYALYEFTGGGWSLNTQITNDNRLGGGFTQISEGACCAFTDPTTGDLIAITNGKQTNFGATYGSMAFRLTPNGTSFTVNEITGTVIPAGLQPGVRGSTNAIEDRWYVFDSTDTPGSNEIYFFTAEGPAPGTSYTVYQWNGVASVITSIGSGPSTTVYSIPEAANGGGDRIFRSSGNQPAIETGAAVLGGYQISYRVYGTQSGQSVTGWYSQEQESPMQQMTISAQTGGSGITGGNTVTGITGDDGATLFTLTWDTTTDNIPSGDTCSMFLDIS